MRILNNKVKYIEFCKNENIPVFSQYWWLDAVCDENNWDVILIERGGEIWVSMPYFIEKKYGFTIIRMPPTYAKNGTLYKISS
jgi:hypothetical protein